MMVDATVVMVENIYRHLEEHREHSMRETILVAAQEIGRPMFFAILIIIAVFLPVFTLQGIEGKLFKPLAYAVTFSMFGSLLMSLCIAPMLCALVAPIEEGRADAESDRSDSFKAIYVPVLKWTMVHRYITVLIAVLLIAWSVAERLHARQRISADDRRRQSAGPGDDAREHLAYSRAIEISTRSKRR